MTKNSQLIESEISKLISNVSNQVIESNEKTSATIGNANKLIVEDIYKLTNIITDKITNVVEEFETIGMKFETITSSTAKGIHENSEELNGKIKNALEDIMRNSNLISETSKAQIENIEKVSQQIGASYDKLVEDFANRLKDNFEIADEKMNKSIVKLEETLDKNLNDSLGHLVGALQKVSEKFVDDYSPLTRKLQDLVNIARGVNA